MQLVEEVEVSGSEEEIEDEQEETEDGGQSSGSELEPLEEDDVWFLSHSLFSDEPCVQWLFKSNSTSGQYVTLRIKIA